MLAQGERRTLGELNLVWSVQCAVLRKDRVVLVSLPVPWLPLSLS